MSDNIQPNSPHLLAGYIGQAELAAQLRVSKRTLARYENEVDGLPSMTVGGHELYPMKEVALWLDRRIRRPNPTRGVRHARGSKR